MVKFNFGIVFLATFTVISLVIGLYFLKSSLLFSTVFFIAAIINSILFYKEYCNRQDTTGYIPEEITIKYPISSSIVTILTYSIFPAVAIFGLFISREHFNLTNSTVVLIIALFVSIFILVSYLEIKKKSEVFIILSNKGIQLGHNSVMKWNEIQQEKIISRHVKGHDHRRDDIANINYLYFFYNNQKN